MHPARAQLSLAAATTAFATGGYFPNPCWLDSSGWYKGQAAVAYANGTGVSNLILKDFAACNPLPPGGAAVLIAVNARFDGVLQGPGGPLAVSAPAVIQAMFNHNAVDHFDTEMVQMNVGGGTLPPGVLIRESPVLPSNGVTETHRMGGGLQIDSFFDVFTEISLNNGATWSLSVGSTRIVLYGHCYANCDQSSGTPAITANDFQCFMNKYTAGEPYANCDGSTTSPALTANDFQCFLNRVAAGCS